MKRSKFTEAQIAFILRQAEEGTAVAEHMPQGGHFGRDILHLWTALPLQAIRVGSRQTWVPTSIRRRQECWRAQMGNPRGVSLNNWAASQSHYKSQVPHAPITSAGTLL